MNTRYNGVIDCAVKITREEGFKALLRGLGPRCTWIGIGGSVFFVSLEEYKRLLSY